MLNTDEQHEQLLEELKAIKTEIILIDTNPEGYLIWIITIFCFLGGAEIIRLLNQIVDLLKGLQ